MIREDKPNKITQLPDDPLIFDEAWKNMANDIEVYDNIQKIVVKAFEVLVPHMPEPVRTFAKGQIEGLGNVGVSFDFEELTQFFKMADVFSQSLLTQLDDQDIPDFAAPYIAATYLDYVIHIRESGFTQENITELGRTLAVNLHALEVKVRGINWQKGW